MKIVMISDLHGHLPPIPECDLLLIAGDIVFDADPFVQRSWLCSVFKDWLDEVPAREVLGIAGNHDWLFQLQMGFGYDEGPRWQYLEDSCVMVGDLKVYGTPWTPKLGRWAFMLEDESLLERKFLGIPDDTNILVSHGPPYGILDQPVPYDERHTGSTALLEKIESLKELKLVVFGHIHGSHGIVKRNGVTYVNASLREESFNVVNQPLMLIH